MANDGIIYKWSRTKAEYLSTCAGNLGNGKSVKISQLFFLHAKAFSSFSSESAPNYSTMTGSMSLFSEWALRFR